MQGGQVIGTIVVVALVSSLAAAVAAAFISAASSGARRTTRSVRLPAACRDPLAGDSVPCTLELVGFTGDYGTVQAILRFTSGVTGHSTHILAGLRPATEKQRGRSGIVGVTTEPIDQVRLGVHLRTGPIRLVLRAERRTLVGDLVSGLGFGSAQSEARALNRLLAQSTVQVA
jgi:hypothetical protein